MYAKTEGGPAIYLLRVTTWLLVNKNQSMTNDLLSMLKSRRVNQEGRRPGVEGRGSDDAGWQAFRGSPR